MFSSPSLQSITQYECCGGSSWLPAPASEPPAQGHTFVATLNSCFSQYHCDNETIDGSNIICNEQHKILDIKKFMNITSVLFATPKKIPLIQESNISNLNFSFTKKDTEASKANSPNIASRPFKAPHCEDAASSVPSSAALFLLVGKQVNSLPVSLGTHHDKIIPRTQTPNKFDVLCGKGKPIQAHMGNVLLHKLVDLHMEYYIACHRESKRLFVAQVLDAMKAQGMRFLKRDNGQDDNGLASSSWMEIDNHAAKEKIGHCFRSRQPRAKRQEYV